LSALSPELSGKQLELLKEIIPKLSRVAVLGNSNEPANPKTLREIELAAKAFGVPLQPLDVLGPKDIETAFRAATKRGANALLALASPVLSDHRTQIVDLALKSSRDIYRPDLCKPGLMSYATALLTCHTALPHMSRF
jgi:putative ABC transport system substrate-binding protein